MGLDRVREHLAEYFRVRRLSKRDAEHWANASTLADLREVTAQWLEGNILRNPNYSHGWEREGPDRETEGIAASLAAANRAGYLTWHSQPGEVYEHPGHPPFLQRAEVAGCASWEDLESLCAAARNAGLLVGWHKPPGSSSGRTGRQEACAHHRRNGWSASSLRDLMLTRIGRDAVDEAVDSPQICIADPVPGRPGLLEAALDEFSGRKAPEGEEVAALPQSQDERAKGVEARTHGWDGKPLSEADKRFFALRDSGYTGPIDQDGNQANCLVCDQPDCTGRQGFEGECNGAKAEEAAKAEEHYRWLTKMKTNGLGCPPNWKQTPHCYHCGRDLPEGSGCSCDGAARATTDPTGWAPGSPSHNNSGAGRDNTGGTMSIDLDVPAVNATDASTPETLAGALRDTADNARRSASEKDAQAESLRSQASALADKPDMSESAQAHLNEAARLAEVAEARRGMAAAYEDKAAQVDAQRAK